MGPWESAPAAGPGLAGRAPAGADGAPAKRCAQLSLVALVRQGMVAGGVRRVGAGNRAASEPAGPRRPPPPPCPDHSGCVRRLTPHGHVVLALQLQPELRVVAEIPAKAQRAGSAVIERPSFRMSVMRPDGMPSSPTRRSGSSRPVSVGVIPDRDLTIADYFAKRH